MFVYFVKKKSDTAKTTAKFIADIAAYGKTHRLRSDNAENDACFHQGKLNFVE